MKSSLAIALVVVGFGVGCGVSQGEEDETGLATGAQTAGTPHVCKAQTTFGRNVRLFSTQTTVVLRAEQPEKDIGDPALFSSVQRSSSIVFKTDDFSAVTRVLRSDVRVWDALLDDVRAVPDPAVDLFRARVADTFVSNLECDDGQAPPASTDTAGPTCTTGAIGTGPSLTIAAGPEGSGTPLAPENRYAFDVKYETAPVAVTMASSSSSATLLPTIASVSTLRMKHLPNGADGIASMRSALLESQLNLARDFLGDPRIYDDLDPTLTCITE